MWFWRRGKAEKEAAPKAVRALLFDTFGTTVDWQGSMTATAEKLGAERGIRADWPGLVREWRAHYKPAIQRVREGRRAWAGFDELHREELDKIAGEFGAKKLSGEDRELLTYGWHFLQPWPDVVTGLEKLRKRFVIGPLSNGTVRQMVDLARFGSLPWDVVFGADLFRTYKPDPRLYQGAARLLDLKPEHILMVAAHNEDLEAAAKQGMRTCFVRRQTEDREPTGRFDFVVDGFEDLARVLDAA